MLLDNAVYLGTSTRPEYLALNYGNRHGLITGATGTGKTVTLQILARSGFDLPASATDRDWSKPYEPSQAVEDAWAEVYRNTDRYWALYELAEKLVDLEHRFQQWRFNHMKTVERIIGYRRGTGGSSGVGYLVKALDLRFFPELWTVRTKL